MAPAERRRLRILRVAIAVIIGVVVGGFWLWGRPRSHVHAPTAQTSPADVVLAYTKAERDRDFAGAVSLTVDEPLQENWWSWNTPWADHVHIDGVAIPGGEQPHDVAGHPAAWRQMAVVRTTATLHNFSGVPDTQPDMTWNYWLVRDSDHEPWKIIDQGVPWPWGDDLTGPPAAASGGNPPVMAVTI